MAGSVNKVILIGNLGRDPEIRSLNNGDRVAQLSLATSEQWRDKSSGERKGSTIYVEGQLQTRKWTDQQGVEKYTTEVVIQRFNGQLTMLGGRDGGGGAGAGGGRGDDDYSSGFSTGGANKPSGPKESYDLNDDIPF